MTACGRWAVLQITLFKRMFLVIPLFIVYFVVQEMTEDTVKTNGDEVGVAGFSVLSTTS